MLSWQIRMMISKGMFKKEKKRKKNSEQKYRVLN